MSEQSTSQAGSADQGSDSADQTIFASPTPMDTGFPAASDSQSHHVPLASTAATATTATGPPPAASSANLAPMSAPTPLSAPSATSSATVSRVSSIRSNNAPPSSSNPRIRKGLLSRAGSEAEDRISRAASASHPQLTTDDDDDEPMISDSGPMPRRFASQNRGPSGTAGSSRQSSNSSLPQTNTHYPPNASSSSSIASGNRSGSGDASEGAASSIGGVSLGRAMSVSSVSSVNSTSSLEAAPFREAPLGNVRLGFGAAAASRFPGRNARNHPYGSLTMSTQQPSPADLQPAASQSLAAQPGSAADSHSSNARAEPRNDTSLFSATSAGPSTAATTLSSSAPASDRHKGVPKPASDAWMYRVGPGMRTNKPLRAPSTASPGSPELPLDDAQSATSPAKRSREILRQKFARGAGRIGIRTTGLGPPPSDHYTVYNPLDSSEDEMSLASASRTPLPRSSSYFSAAPHSASSAAGIPLYPLLTPVPGDFRTSTVTNAPLFVPKYADDAHSSRLTPEALAPPGSAYTPRDPIRSAGLVDSQPPSLPPLSYDDAVGSIASDLSPYLVPSGTGQGVAVNHLRRRSSATQKPPYLRAGSSNDAFDRTASPGLLVNDPSAVDAPPASPALYTLSRERSPQVELAHDGNVQVSPHPTPAEVVRMEAQAGIASLPGSPSEPSPVPSSYSPAIEDEGVANRRVRDSSQSRLARPSSGTGSEASMPMGPAAAGTSRRPDSLQRQRLWSNTKRPAILRARTSESCISKGRRSESSDRKAYSPSAQSPVEAAGCNDDRPGTHSKTSSSSTVPGVGGGGGGGELGVRVPPHVAVIPEDDDVGGSGSVGTPDRTFVLLAADLSAGTLSRPAFGMEIDQALALSPPTRAALSPIVRPLPGPRSASPASQLARSPETIRVGPARITDSIYGRSPASVSNLQSPRLQPSSAPERPTTPSSRTSTARGPHDFHFGETLGEGSYSTVLEAWDLLSGPHPKEPGVVDPNATTAAAAMVGSESSKRRRNRIDLTGRKAYAIKVLDKVHILKQGKQKYVAIEKEALSRMIRHPGVVTLFWTFQDRESLYFVLELASNGELLNFIRKHGSFDVASARFYAAQLADTIAGMHAAGVVHRDVKPENILLDARYRVKITDFGSAKIVHPVGRESDAAAPGDISSEKQSGQSRAASFVGTAEYVSPELLVEKAQPAGKPADWWAFGCVLFQLLAGRPPFKGVNEYQTLQKVKNREFTFPSGFPEDAQDLIGRVLVLDPSARLTAAEIKSHRFFAQIDFERLWDVDAPEIRTGLVAPLPQQGLVGDTSDFSFDEGFGSSDESQAYNGDTQSIDYQAGAADESSVSLDGVVAAAAAAEDDADGSGSEEEAVVVRKRQSGLQRLADGFQSRFLPGVAEKGIGNGSVAAAPRRRFSSMSIDAPAPVGAEIDPAGATRGMRPFSSRSMQTMNVHASSHSPSSHTRLLQPPQPPSASTATVPANGGGGALGLQQSWAALLLPKEVMIYSLPVAHRKTGAGKMFSKKRQLVLTDFPRLLCVKETATALKVKSEVILAIPKSDATLGDAAKPTPSPAAGGEWEKLSGRHAAAAGSDDDTGGQDVTAANVRTSSQAIPNLLTGVEYRGGRSFTIRIANGRTFVYDTPGDASALVRCIQEARRAA